MPRSPILAVTLMLLTAPCPARPSILLGPSDGLALEQPRLTVEFSDAGGGIMGPDTANTFLLDTAAERILVAGGALAELRANGYRTDGEFVEQGISGFTAFDVSEPYRLEFVGTGGEVVALDEVRALSRPDSNFGSFGGVIGMPGLAGRVASLDFSTLGDLLTAYLGVEMGPEVPAGGEHRYHVPLQTIAFPLPEPDPPTTSSGIPFMTAVVEAPERKRRGRFVFDTGAQVSILSEHMAFALGLDTDGDGNFDNEALATFPIGGVGGEINAPVLDIGTISLPTSEGVDLSWSAVQALIIEIDPDIDGVFGSDLLTSGWIEALFEGGDGYLQRAHCDFREAVLGRGTLALDLTAELDIVSPGLPPADLDEDFIDDDWECLFYDDLDAARGDDDGDGLDLLLEHALNTDPTKADRSPLQVAVDADGSLLLRFPRNRELHFAELLLESSPSLDSGSWQRVDVIVAHRIPDDALTDFLTVRITPELRANHYRLRAAGLPEE